jgi:protein ImuB
VVSAVVGGGRDPADQVRLVPWGDPREPAHPEIPPWPGHLPAPAPAVVHPTPLIVEVRDATDAPVTVTARGVLSGPPATVSLAGGPWVEVASWAGPWLAEERWWDTATARGCKCASMTVSPV